MVASIALALVAAVAVGGFLVTRYGVLAAIIEVLRDMNRRQHQEH